MISNLIYLKKDLYYSLYTKYTLYFRQLQYLKNTVVKWVNIIGINLYTIYLESKKKTFLNLCFFLKNHTLCLFEQLLDITCVDTLNVNSRFKLVYQILSLTHNVRLTCIVVVNEIDLVLSLTKIYSSAGWFECEVWDLFGVFFQGHEKIHRILTDYGFKGYPLRKDFPLSGYTELFYNETHKLVGYYKISIVQEFRNFYFGHPWLNV